MYELVVLRNMHDLGCGDIPIVLVNWDENDLDSAFDYWVELSKGELSKEEQRKKCRFSSSAWRCFYSSNHIVLL
jgi:hypothetical protein